MIEKVRNYVKEYVNNNNLNLKTIHNYNLMINDKEVKLTDLLIFCTQYLPEDCKITERLYHVMHNLYEKPLCKACKTNTCNFQKFTSGYSANCSKSCANKSLEPKEKKEPKAKEIKLPKLKEVNIEQVKISQPIKTTATNLNAIFSNLTRSEKESDDIGNTEIYEFLKQYNINVELNNNSLGINIGVFLKDYNLGIDYNSNFYHTELKGKDRHYHINKYLLCQKNNIQLVQIFEDEWKLKKDIVKCIILNKLGLLEHKYDARKLKICLIPNDYAKTFLNSSHIQGYIHGKHYGLCTENDVISMVTIGKSRYNKAHELELYRFCHKKNCTTRGGLSRLIKHSFKIHNATSIVTYCDLRYGNGNGYRACKFTQINISNPNYFYIDPMNCLERMSRVQFQKHKLESKLAVYDPKLTEFQNMVNNGFDRLWDCGNLVFEYRL